MLSMPLMSRLFNRYDSRIVLTAASVLFLAPILAMSSFTTVIQWHLAGIIMGFGFNLLTIVAPPILLSNWFKEKTGLAIGISSSFAGLVGAVCNSIISMVVVQYGWRTAYMVNGCIAFAMVLPATLLILRYKPADLGMEAYGHGTVSAGFVQEEDSYTDKEIRSRSVLIMILTVGISFGAGFIHMLNAYGVSIGMATTVAALLASISMIGNTIFKLLMGWMTDKLGTRGPALMCYLLAAVGSITLIIFRAPLIYISAILFGFTAVAYTTLSSLVTKAALGSKGFRSFYPKVSMIMVLLSSFMGTIHGWVYDTTGAYTISLILCAAGMLVSAVIVILLFYSRKRV